MLLSKCMVCNSKKSRFINKQESIRILLLGLNSPLKNVLLLGALF